VVICGRDKRTWETNQPAVLFGAGIAGSRIQFIQADVRYEPDVVHLLNEVYSRYGRPDVCVNNAGVYTTPGVPLEDTVVDCTYLEGGAAFFLPPSAAAVRERGPT
jgi:NAD(P)-dependent dehydrogenase (short-subunit alcohol dehydrogenase family)